MSLLFIDYSSDSCEHHLSGGKAKNLWLLGRLVDCSVPPWFVVTTDAFDIFMKENGIIDKLLINPGDLESSTDEIHSLIMKGVWPESLKQQLEQRLTSGNFIETFVAVRSSGTDEDSGTHSFAGQFESFLFQLGLDQVLTSIKKCWCSCFSERVMSHRLELGMNTTRLKMAVIVQVMVNPSVSGVAFSRHPLYPISSNCVFIEAVYGLGEGLVSGELEADRYEVSRESLKVSAEIVDKSEKFIRSDKGGVQKVKVEEESAVKGRCLTDEEACTIAKLMIKLEDKMKCPQDFEWGLKDGDLYCLQTRPIVTLPPSCFFDHSVPGKESCLFDNSNIIESYSGVTSPLTFSFVSIAYEMVYTLTLQGVGVPEKIVKENEPYLKNMLGLVRGNVYYNLMNWYRCLSLLPVGDTSKYMETMMGVKRSLDPSLEAELGLIKDSAPRYSFWHKLKLIFSTIHKIYSMDSLVAGFFTMFNKNYNEALEIDFTTLSLQQQVAFVKHLFKDVLGNWMVPIYNDTYVMLFFGMLKKMVSNNIHLDDPSKAQSLQNDLLCGQGDVESTEPTKMLMRIADHVDNGRDDIRQWFLSCHGEVLDMLADEKYKEKAMDQRLAESTVLESHSDGLRQRKGKNESQSHTETPMDETEQEKLSIVRSIRAFLRKYGFRCINELKLEEKTLHDDPRFVLDAISGYVRTKSYVIDDMEKRERLIRTEAEKVVNNTLSFPKRMIFNWLLFHARRAVKHRENMRFARTKLFGIFRDVFRGIGHNLKRMNLLEDVQDVFYLTIEELNALVDGRSITNDLRGLVELRKKEFDGYRKGMAPPDRFMTTGACSLYFLYPQVLNDLDLLRDLEAEASADPNVLKGTPCCPGVVTNTVRVVKSIDEASGLNGEILVTGRTDPGWVPLYPLCSGLIIERGSLLSHSAVVARELGLPTIVGVSGGLMKRLKTGMTVEMDAGKGIVNILRLDETAEKQNND